MPVYLFLATLPCDALSAFLVFCGHVVYRPYLAGDDDHGMFGLSPLEDQALAGALMWVTVTFVYLIPALVLTARLLASERTQPRKWGLVDGRSVHLCACYRAEHASAGSLRSAIPDFLALTKPEVNFLIVIATFTGFYLGYPGDLAQLPARTNAQRVMWDAPGGERDGYAEPISGTPLRCADAADLHDARLRRADCRPATAAWFGISLSIAGSVYLLATVNALSSALAVFTAATYLLIYTPLKRKTPLCTFVGAVPGAMPPLIGWAAAAGSVVSAKAWMLYIVLFLWQFPHFMAIAWMYREDYARAGYLVLPPGEQSGRFMSWQALLASLALIPVSLIPAMTGHAGPVYFILAGILSSLFFYYSAGLAFQRSTLAARRLLLASIVYLPLAFCLLMSWK